jgi:hypothetical protein
MKTTISPFIFLVGFQMFWTGCGSENGTGLPAGDRVTVYDNFGPGWEYRRTSGWAVAGKDGGNSYEVEQAMAFTPIQGGVLSDVWIAVSHGPGDKAKQVLVKISEDSSGFPGAVLESWILDTGFVEWGVVYNPHHMKGVGKTVLTPGVRYWLWATAEDSTAVAWNFHREPTFTCPHTLRRNKGPWLDVASETCSAFRVDVVKQSQSAYF